MLALSSGELSPYSNKIGIWQFWRKESSLFPGACMLSHFSHVWLFAIPWIVSRQPPLSMGILQARILEWVVMPSSRGSSQPRDWNGISSVSCIGRWVLYHWHNLGIYFLVNVSKIPWEDSHWFGLGHMSIPESIAVSSVTRQRMNFRIWWG